MATYYVLDADEFQIEDFAEECKKFEACSEADAAEGWAGEWWDYHDGMTGECLVSKHPDGRHAERFVVRCIFTIDFRAKAAR